MLGNNTIKGSYVSIALKDTPTKNYIELRPPQGKNNNTKVVDIIVVLDCSGSMCGQRIRIANKILDKLFQSPNVKSLSIIKFGSTATQPTRYERASMPLTEQEADLGGTDFPCACIELINAVKTVDENQETMVLFLSDGEGIHPTQQYAELELVLKHKNVNLQSIAISHAADAEVMIRLANMNGDLGMIFLKDSMSDDECVDKFFKEVGAVGLIDELKVNFIDKNTKESLKLEVLKYRRGEEVVGLISPPDKTINDLELIAELEDNTYTIELEDVNISDDYSHKAGFLCSYILNESKKIIGKFVVKEISNTEAKKLITDLKTLYTANFDEKTLLDKIVSTHSVNDELTAEGKNKMRQLKKDIKSINLMTLQTLNTHISVVEDNNLGMALEAYSGQKVNSKFNKRLLEIAAKNKSKNQNLVAKTDVEHLLNNQKPMPNCIVWMSNPFETANEDFENLEQNEWVGNAAMIDPGKIAAISPWNLKSVVLKPIYITNTALELIGADGNEKRKVWLQGYDAEFNTCLPLIDPSENEDAVRLALFFMQKSVDGNQEISRMITSIPDLYNPAMKNALYTCATLSTLREAQTALDFELAFKSYLTLLDSNFYTHKENKGSEYFEKVLNDVLADSSKFISKKDDTDLPNISRSMMFLNTVDAAFAVDEKVINNIFLKLFVRLCCDQTSQKYNIEEVAGVKMEDYRKKIGYLFSTNSSKKTKEIENPKMEFGPLPSDFKLSFGKIYAIYGIHKVMRDFLKSENLSLQEFYTKVMNSQISLEKVTALFKEVQIHIKQKPVEFLKKIANDDSIDGRKLYQSILTLCCYNHTTKNLPAHDSAHNETVLRKCENVQDIITHGEAAKDTYLSSLIASQAKKAKRLFGIKKKVIKWANKVREIRNKYPLEKLRHIFEHHSLSYSNEHEEFKTRRRMFTFLDDFGFKDEDLSLLEQIPLETFDSFDLNAWKKEHKYHLYGFYNYAPVLLSECESKEQFLIKIEAALENHYSGEIDPSLKRNFTARMRSYLPEFSTHFFEEFHIDQYLNSLKGFTQGLSVETIKAKIYELSPSIHEIDEERRKLRDEHFKTLIHEKLGL